MPTSCRSKTRHWPISCPSEPSSLDGATALIGAAGYLSPEKDMRWPPPLRPPYALPGPPRPSPQRPAPRRSRGRSCPPCAWVRGALSGTDGKPEVPGVPLTPPLLKCFVGTRHQKFCQAPLAENTPLGCERPPKFHIYSLAACRGFHGPISGPFRGRENRKAENCSPPASRRETRQIQPKVGMNYKNQVSSDR